MTDTKEHSCIHCGRDDSQVPLIGFLYKGGKYRICTEHLPVLIHEPTELDGKLPDMDKLNPAESD